MFLIKEVWMPSYRFSWCEIKSVPHHKLYNSSAPIKYCPIICFPDLYIPQAHMLWRNLLIPQHWPQSQHHSEKDLIHLFSPKVTSPERPSLRRLRAQRLHPLVPGLAPFSSSCCLFIQPLQFPLFFPSSYPIYFTFKDYLCVYLIKISLFQSRCKFYANKD